MYHLPLSPHKKQLLSLLSCRISTLKNLFRAFGALIFHYEVFLNFLFFSAKVKTSPHHHRGYIGEYFSQQYRKSDKFPHHLGQQKIFSFEIFHKLENGFQFC